MTKRIDELVQSICGAAGHPLAPLLRRWCGESRLFSDFAEAHASKIRKKARLAPLDDDLADLLAELAIAALLLRDRRFSVRYEPARPGGQRAPDFQVIFKTHLPFHVEVTRLRELAEADLAGATLKLARVVCAKIGQLPAGAMSMLAVVVPPGAQSDALAPAAIRLLDSYPQPGLPLPELRLEDVRDFQRQRHRLSAIALCSFTGDWRPQRVTLWQNQQAKHPLHPDVARFLVQST
jgi:hypothetical protein